MADAAAGDAAVSQEPERSSSRAMKMEALCGAAGPAQCGVPMATDILCGVPLPMAKADAGGDRVCGLSVCGLGQKGAQVPKLAYVGTGRGDYVKDTTYAYVGYGAGEYELPGSARGSTCWRVCAGVAALAALVAVVVAGMFVFRSAQMATTTTVVFRGGAQTATPYCNEGDIGQWSAEKKVYCCRHFNSGCETRAREAPSA